MSVITRHVNSFWSFLSQAALSACGICLLDGNNLWRLGLSGELAGSMARTVFTAEGRKLYMLICQAPELSCFYLPLLFCPVISRQAALPYIRSPPSGKPNK